MKEFGDMFERRKSRTQILESPADLDLLVRGKDVLVVQRTNHPDCAPELFLYITKGKTNLILWGTGHGRGDVSGRIIKLPLQNIIIDAGMIKIPDYSFNLFFNLNEGSYEKLYESGLLV